MQVSLPEEEAAKQAAKPERLAIGGEGGFQTEASTFTLAKAHALVVLPEMLSVPLPCPDLPELVLGAIQGVMVRAGLLAVLLPVPPWDCSCASYPEGGRHIPDRALMAFRCPQRCLHARDLVVH